MSTDLKTQIHLYSLDTSCFYNEREQIIHRKLLKSYQYKKHLISLEKEDIEEDKRQKHLKFIRDRVGKLKQQLHFLLKNNKGTRKLNPEYLRDNNVISVFDSVLTRTLGIKKNELTEEIFVVRTYYFEVLKDLIDKGFIHNNEKYVYFSSSAGQIRTKKGVWIKESSWKRYENSLTCGLSLKDINKQGGNNVNRFLAYMALTNSASTEFKDFDINRTIVVDDLETNVVGLVDFIDRESYEITRRKMEIPIEHTDGAGMILPQKSKKSFMFRSPFMKGLLIPFAFDEFAKQYNKFVVKDIYGEERDIIKERIEIIFTKSQFKMWKYYKSWDEYRKNFIKYNSQAAKLNEEEDEIGNARLNYQMLQTLTDITDEELLHISQSTVEDIEKISSDKKTMLRVLGATDRNRNKNYFQEALTLYPELLNDIHSKEVIKDVKKSLIKEAKSGKLNISGKYTFVCPDLYAFCERLFLGIEEPLGLLKADEVYCNLYQQGKVDMLRSPHLYREHGVKNNTIDEQKRKWFITKGIYTSIHDTVSKMLQFDVDGDQSLVIDDPVFVEVAERNMKGIVPLYYEMADAPVGEINSDKMYHGLIKAFKANIGEISNDITKIWNNKEPDLDVVKWLCMENNFVIDYAKTLYMPQRPKHIDERIKKNIKYKVPHFFIHAKKREENRVEPLNNSVVNRLERIIPDNRIFFRKIAGRFDYKLLLKNKSIKLDEDIIQQYEEINKNKRWRIKKHKKKGKGKFEYVDQEIRKELLEVNEDIEYTVDVLVKYLYGENNSRSKSILWDSFGDVLVKRLEKNLKDTKQCENCGDRVEVKSNRTKYCNKCAVKINRIKTKQRVRKHRM